MFGGTIPPTVSNVTQPCDVQSIESTRSAKRSPGVLWRLKGAMWISILSN